MCSPDFNYGGLKKINELRNLLPLNLIPSLFISFIHLQFFSNIFILVRVLVDPESIPGTHPGKDAGPYTHTNSYTGQFIIDNPPTGLFWERKTCETQVNTGRAQTVTQAQD